MFVRGHLALCRLLAAAIVASGRQFSTVVIDAGHGGFDLGGIPRSDASPRKGWTLMSRNGWRQKLRSAGYRVVMTRDSDVFVSLGERVADRELLIATRFVCVHFNSATRAGANGIETYYFSDQSAALAANIHRQVVGGTTPIIAASVGAVTTCCGERAFPQFWWNVGFLLTRRKQARLAKHLSRKTGRPHRRWRYGERPPPYRPVVAGLTHVQRRSRSPPATSILSGPTPERHASHSSRSAGRAAKKRPPAQIRKAQQ